MASPIVQTVVNDIYSGRVIYSSSANRSIVADNYKLRAIEIYNSRNAPWLNHYRYVPLLSIHPHNRIRIYSYQFACAALWGNPRVPEFRFFTGHIHFVPLLHVSSFLPLSTFSLNFVTDKDLNTPNAFEILFIVFAAAFALEEYTASVEHGWSGECGHHVLLLTLLMKPSVYFANVSNRIIIRRVTFPNQNVLDVECLR